MIFPALADGRLSQTTILLVKPHLISHNAPMLIEAAMGKSKRQVERLLAAKFPRPDVPTSIQPWKAPLVMGETALDVAAPAVPNAALSNNLVAPVHVVPSFTPAHTIPMVPPAPRAKVEALSADRNALQVTIDDECVELLDQARDLLSHALPNADAGAVLKRALQCLVRELERRKFAKVESPRDAKSEDCDSNHIPASVKREVSERDGDACGFEAPDGTRCGSRYQLEWDHKEPVAQGGKSTAENLRQLCRAHNQYEAERRFGKGFMAQKRDAGRARSR